MLRANQRITISDGRGDDVFGRVEEVIPLGDLSAVQLRESLAAWGVSRVASISYRSSGTQLMVTVVEIEGEWFDLHRRPLHIEVVGLCASGLPS